IEENDNNNDNEENAVDENTYNYNNDNDNSNNNADNTRSANFKNESVEETKQYIESPYYRYREISPRDESADSFKINVKQQADDEKKVNNNIKRRDVDNNTSNINVNNSNINDIIKRDLQEYLSNLENQNVIKV